jgi:hypothetical protein
MESESKIIVGGAPHPTKPPAIIDETRVRRADSIAAARTKMDAEYDLIVLPPE